MDLGNSLTAVPKNIENEIQLAKFSETSVKWNKNTDIKVF